jgi:ATP-dependent exoDNAse (exonuclease V) beta subunit
MTKPRINCVVASAGAGKTTRIVDDIAREVANRAPEELLATTFTVKASDELVERSRAKLFGDGQAQKASRLLGARFGTVNSVCGRIAAEFAIDLGRSPQTEVIAEGSVERVFAMAADRAIDAYAPRLNALAEAFGYSEPQFGGGSDWRETVQRIIELARSNGISPDDLSSSRERSLATFSALLPAPAADFTSVEQMLKAAVDRAAGCAPADPSTKAKACVPHLHRLRAELLRGERLKWPDWARLSKVDCAKKDGQAFAEALADIRSWAANFLSHPQLRADCTDFIRSLFQCAAEALQAYQDFKAERGLLDFTDQETLALEVLANEKTRARLAERVRRVFVDEFQDSSPLQLAIFTALANVVEESTWVGDPKQAIYGFRNADSALTQAAFAGVIGGQAAPENVLSISYRSRKGIVDLVNAAFTPAFEAMGLPRSEHAFSAAHRADAGFEHSALAVWELDGPAKKRPLALACAIEEALSSAGDWLVQEKGGEHRPLRAGDIAILCRSNDNVALVAAALSARGIKVGVERSGLAQTPHVQLASAALRWTADPTDRLALAELARFFGAGEDTDEWLQALGAEDPDLALRAVAPVSDALASLRNQLMALTPAELLDAILGLPEIMALVESFGDCATRLDDLEALRGFARDYENECAGSGAPATASGLVLALKGANPPRPPSLHPDVVQVMTYHSAKGLEWPLVVLTDLHHKPKPRLFTTLAEADGKIDWASPLSGRWIRYWPWPFGQQNCDALEQAALNTEIGQAAAQRAREEETRLLYVGTTRARDYLVFAPATKDDPAWLDVLDTGAPGHVRLAGSPSAPLVAGTETFAARFSPYAPEEAAARLAPQPTYVRLPRSIEQRRPLQRTPSKEAATSQYQVVERIQLGPRISITGSPKMADLGEAVHAIIAADDPAAPLQDRIERAQATLDRWRVHEIKADAVCDASARLHADILRRWPTGTVLKEAPVHARLEDQLVSGRIDLVVEHDKGFVVIDHKSFPGAPDQWEARAVGYGAQLELYAEAITVATGRPCDVLFVHMPMVGALLRLARQPAPEPALL